ncbi:helix-turn-helix domain-containing protein [Leisingera sp. HS039]|uniref:helix-turn-helix domain-containing protein n=1 Tax=Leisingera sp. HS039 TaxID=2818496 RepID=UPI001B3A0F9B|nr:helix-turn-helix domain-containing protein [Leisingera sp. HS039]MBQ4827533.1 helix-turn-helix domain-containing protein [Leisingera sp. HS039]
MISPQKAAERAGVSRRTIMVAIEGKSLKAQRNNRNHWQIDPEDLKTWIESRGGKPDLASLDVSVPPTEPTVEVARLTEQLRAAEDRITDLETRLEKKDADFRERLTQRNADYREAMGLLKEAQRPRGLLELIWGRKDKSPG